MNIYPIFDRMLTRADKEQLLGQRGMMIWFTGLSGSGKSTIAIALERELQRRRLLCGQRTVGKAHVPPGRQPEQLPRVKIRVRAACGGQTLLHLPHRCAGEHCFAYHLPSSGFSGSTGVMAAMATSIILSSGSKTVRCCTQMPGCRMMRVAMLSDRPHHLSSS